MPATVVNYTRGRPRTGKFVILLAAADPGDGLILFSDFSRDSQHADIVRRWESGSRDPASAAGRRIAGGGWWRLADGGVLELFGGSVAYGPFDPGWLAANLLPPYPFDAGKVRISRLA